MTKKEAEKLLQDVLDVLSDRDVASEKAIDSAMLNLFRLRDAYFLGMVLYVPRTTKRLKPSVRTPV